MFQDIDYSLIVLQLEKAMANGVATLDSNTKVPTNQISLTASDVGAIASTGNGVLTALNAASGTISSGLLPSYVDDFLTFANLAAFPVSGETGKIYLAENTNLSYRWAGSSYVDISSAGVSDAALKLNTARTIAGTGDASYSVSFDGSANVSGTMTLANSGVVAGTYNALATQVRPFTVDAKGRITATGTAVDITPPWSVITSKPTTLDGFGITGGTIAGDLISTSATISTSTTTGAIRAASLGITGAIFAGTVSAASYNSIFVGMGGGNISSNTVIGTDGLFANTTGNTNSAVGVNTLRNNTTGINNSAVGSGGLFSNTSGGANSGVGVNALRNNTTGTNNSAVGVNALSAVVAGTNNSAIGTISGRLVADGVTLLSISNNSCFFGANTKGTQNATNENVIGYNATGNGSNTVTIGDSNITNTYLKGVVTTNSTTESTSITTGASIIPGGQGIGGNQYIGGDLIVLGDINDVKIGIGINNTTIKIGNDAGFSNTSGTNWSTIGNKAGYSNTSGTNWVALGSTAGYFNVSGGGWSAIGVNAGLNNLASNWVSLGNSAGRFIANGSTILTNSANSCYVGTNAKAKEDNVTNENVFGYNTIGNGSNTVTIGDSNITQNYFRGSLFLNEIQSLTTRRGGWTAPTGTATRTTFVTSTVTLPQLAERVKALIDDLTTHGLIGA